VYVRFASGTSHLEPGTASSIVVPVIRFVWVTVPVAVIRPLIAVADLSPWQPFAAELKNLIEPSKSFFPFAALTLGQLYFMGS